MNQKIWILSTLILLILLAACAAETPAPTATLTETPILLSTNSQVTYEPTFTITPSQTLRPTSTPYPTITPSPEPWPTITMPPFPTPNVNFKQTPVNISPTGKWIAWDVSCETSTGYLCFQFINQDGSQIWSFSNDNIVVNSRIPFHIRVTHWSPDNKFVYMTLSPMDFDAIYEYSMGIIKYSLVNGAFNFIITPEDILYSTDNDPFTYPALYTCAFSNDGQWLVYAVKNGQSLDFTLQNLYSGETKYFSVIIEEDSFYGDITWSPDNEFFVFSVDEGMTYIGETEDFSIFLITLEDLSIKRISAHGDMVFLSPEWISNKEVSYEFFWEGEHVLNIETGEITEVDD